MGSAAAQDRSSRQARRFRGPSPMSEATSGARHQADRSSLWTAAAVATLLALGVRARRRVDAYAADRYDRPMPRRQATSATPRHRDWKLVLQRLREDLTKRRIIAIAAGVTFYSILAIFPALAALVALYGLLADPSTIARNLDSVASVIPSGGIEVLREE